LHRWLRSVTGAVPARTLQLFVLRGIMLQDAVAPWYTPTRRWVKAHHPRSKCQQSRAQLRASCCRAPQPGSTHLRAGLLDPAHPPWSPTVLERHRPVVPRRRPPSLPQKKILHSITLSNLPATSPPAARMAPLSSMVPAARRGGSTSIATRPLGRDDGHPSQQQPGSRR